MPDCTYFKPFMDEQIKLIRRHLDRHKWFQHITDRQQAVADFVEKYGELLREMYCETACPIGGRNCESYKAFLQKQGLPLEEISQPAVSGQTPEGLPQPAVSEQPQTEKSLETVVVS